MDGQYSHLSTLKPDQCKTVVVVSVAAAEAVAEVVVAGSSRSK